MEAVLLALALAATAAVGVIGTRAVAVELMKVTPLRGDSALAAATALMAAALCVGVTAALT